MRLSDTIKTASQGVTLKKGRSFLTMLGIIIGVGSVVLMTAIGASMEDVILSQISSLGAKSMVVFPGQQEGGPNQFSTGFDSLTFGDVEAISRLQTVTSLAPNIFVPAVSKYGRESVEHTVVGTVPNFFQNQNISAERGRLLEDDDVDKAKPVTVLGKDTAERLFGQSDPMGKRVTIGDKSYVVVGIMKPIGTQFFQNFDERLFIPLSVARSVTGQKYLNYMTMQSTYDFNNAIRDVKDVLRRRHGIVNSTDDPDKDDFVVRTSEQASDILGAVSLGLTLFITLVAGISLVVGGIGIMNIMLVAVSERTREIGLRKAVGATRGDLLIQFLLESMALTFLGGCIGMVLGVGGAAFAALIVNKFLATYVFALSIPAIGWALGMAVVTGLIFGMYPATKASRLSPIEALRYE